ncbi:MAG: DUF2501 domain-containing protein [Sphingobium sp.]
MKRVVTLGVIIGLAAVGLAGGGSAPARAQDGLLGSILGGALPDIGAVGASNAAGVLSYCVKNRLLRSTRGAAGVLGRLTGQEDVRESDAFRLGESGILQSNGTRLPLDSLKGKVKNGLCDLVLKHSRTFL